MLGRKCEKKNRHRGIKVAVGILAAIGAVGIVRGGRRWIRDRCDGVMSALGKKKRECCDVESQDE